MPTEFKQGTYAVGDREIYFRSLWEANYALYLHWLKKQGHIRDWEYEPERYYFILTEGNRQKALGNGYLPDFRITRNDGTQYLTEIKGRRQGMVKLKRMKKYYPHLPVELVEKKDYETLKRKLGRLLNFYD